MSFDGDWSYNQETENEWNESTCKNSNTQSPINIDTNNLSSCDQLCNIAMKYSKSKCHIEVKKKTPFINFDNGSFLKYINNRKILQLRNASIHVPSMHTVDGANYDMEIILYHKTTGSLYTDSTNYMPTGGTAISIFFQISNSDYGKQNQFFNTFVNKIPSEDTNVEISIPVGENWGPELILPDKKSFYFYEGSLPFPPCEEKWNWIVFEEVQGISDTIISKLKLSFNNNIRTIKPLNDRVISYNSNSVIPTDNELEKKAKSELEKSTPVPTNIDKDSNRDKERNMIDKNKAKTAEFFKSKKVYIQNILLGIVMILLIYTSLKVVKYIVKNDILNKIMVRQALGLSKEEGKNISSKLNSNKSNSSQNSMSSQNMNTMNNQGSGPGSVGPASDGPGSAVPASAGPASAGPASAGPGSGVGSGNMSGSANGSTSASASANGSISSSTSNASSSMNNSIASMK